MCFDFISLECLVCFVVTIGQYCLQKDNTKDVVTTESDESGSDAPVGSNQLGRRLKGRLRRNTR